MEEQKKKKSVEDYELLTNIGDGAYGTVYLSREKKTDKKYAIKSVDK
jgi:serine/threonine protein kinase